MNNIFEMYFTNKSVTNNYKAYPIQCTYILGGSYYIAAFISNKT